MFSNYLIGLREGFEAALIVAILIAYLVRTSNGHAVRRVWQGVAAAIALSVALGALLVIVDESLSDTAEPAFSGFMSIVAVGLITWMVFWMALHARSISTHLHGELDRAVATSGIAVAAVAFVAVAREGLETALFLWAGINATGGAGMPVLGAVLGLATAVALGFALYRGVVKLNMAKLFMWTGAALVIVAGGMLRYAVAEFQEIGWLPGEHAYAYDLTASIDPEGVPATIVRSLVNITPAMSWLELAVWLAYVVPTLILFFVVIRRRDAAAAAAKAAQKESVPSS